VQLGKGGAPLLRNGLRMSSLPLPLPALHTSGGEPQCVSGGVTAPSPPPLLLLSITAALASAATPQHVPSGPDAHRSSPADAAAAAAPAVQPPAVAPCCAAAAAAAAAALKPSSELSEVRLRSGWCCMLSCCSAVCVSLCRWVPPLSRNLRGDPPPAAQECGWYDGRTAACLLKDK